MIDPDAPRGVWVAYYPDWSGAAVFPTEVAALRHAVANHMEVVFAEFGKELREVVIQ